MPLASGRTARKGFHWKAGGQDTQDHQDTQDVAGPQVGEREAQAAAWKAAFPVSASRKALTGNDAARMAAFPVSRALPCARRAA